MKTIDIQTIKDEVAKQRLNVAWLGLEDYEKNYLWPEVCKRYAIEVAKASLEKAYENAEIDDPSSWGPSATLIKESITSEDNIVL